MHVEYKYHEGDCVRWELVGKRAVWLGCEAPSEGVLEVAGFSLQQGRKIWKALVGWVGGEGLNWMDWDCRLLYFLLAM